MIAWISRFVGNLQCRKHQQVYPSCFQLELLDVSLVVYHIHFSAHSTPTMKFQISLVWQEPVCQVCIAVFLSTCFVIESWWLNRIPWFTHCWRYCRTWFMPVFCSMIWKTLKAGQPLVIFRYPSDTALANTLMVCQWGGPRGCWRKPEEAGKLSNLTQNANHISMRFKIFEIWYEQLSEKVQRKSFMWVNVLCHYVVYVVLLVADTRARKRWSWNMLWHKPDAHKTRWGGKEATFNLLSFCLILSKTHKGFPLLLQEVFWLAESSTFADATFRNHHDTNILLTTGSDAEWHGILVWWSKFGPSS